MSDFDTSRVSRRATVWVTPRVIGGLFPRPCLAAWGENRRVSGVRETRFGGAPAGIAVGAHVAVPAGDLAFDAAVPVPSEPVVTTVSLAVRSEIRAPKRPRPWACPTVMRPLGWPCPREMTGTVPADAPAVRLAVPAFAQVVTSGKPAAVPGGDARGQ